MVQRIDGLHSELEVHTVTETKGSGEREIDAVKAIATHDVSPCIAKGSESGGGRRLRVGRNPASFGFRRGFPLFKEGIIAEFRDRLRRTAETGRKRCRTYAFCSFSFSTLMEIALKERSNTTFTRVPT